MITIENKDNEIKLQVQGDGKQKDLIEEATFLINRTTDIYDAVIDNLPILAQLRVICHALDRFKEKNREGEDDD